MLVRPKYTSEEGTPLFFLKFLKIVLPIGIILRLFVLVSLFSQEFSAYSLLYCAANLALAFVAAVYLNKMEWKGVLAFYGIFAVQIADKTLEFLLLTSYGLPPSVGTVIGTVLGELVVLVPVIVYFDKRRLLFAPPPKKPTYTPAIPKQRYDQQEQPVEQWYTCPKCGQLVRKGEECDCSTPAAQPAPPPEREYLYKWSCQEGAAFPEERTEEGAQASETPEALKTLPQEEAFGCGTGEKRAVKSRCRIYILAAALILSVAAAASSWIVTCQKAGRIEELEKQVEDAKAAIEELEKQVEDAKAEAVAWQDARNTVLEQNRELLEELNQYKTGGETSRTQRMLSSRNATHYQSKYFQSGAQLRAEGASGLEAPGEPKVETTEKWQRAPEAQSAAPTRKEVSSKSVSPK